MLSNLEDIFYKLGFYTPTWRTFSTNWDFMLQLGGHFLQIGILCSNLEDAFYPNKDRATELFNTFFHQLSFLLSKRGNKNETVERINKILPFFHLTNLPRCIPEPISCEQHHYQAES